MTALETISDGIAYPTTVTTAGRIVAFTLVARLAPIAPRPSRTSTLDSYGGIPLVAITVRVPSGRRVWTVGCDRRARCST